jgi:hypothetical protein
MAVVGIGSGGRFADGAQTDCDLESHRPPLLLRTPDPLGHRISAPADHQPAAIIVAPRATAVELLYPGSIE